MEMTRQAGAARPHQKNGRAAQIGSRERAVGTLCGVVSVFLFSSFTLVSRLGLTSSLSLPDLAALRFGIGGLLLMPVLLRHGLSAVTWREAAALAFFGGLGFAVFAYAGFSLAPAAHGAVLLHGTLPLFTWAIMGLIQRRHVPRSQVVGIVLIATGVALMAYDSVAGASPRQLLGDGCLLVASLLWSSYGVLSRRLGLPPAQGASIVAVFSMCCFLPVYLLLPAKAILLVGHRELLLQAGVQGVLIGAVSIFVYTRAVAALGPDRMALFTAAVPCITTLVAIPLLSEVPSIADMIGVGAVTFGMMVALRPIGGASISTRRSRS
ncbi:MAG TPA: DMT family transporter [Alphaproteobacteria bacterium]|nr:DMT family transporter [Alphaproteobacteria bacterium]